jgi:hypothetical protein
VAAPASEALATQVDVTFTDSTLRVSPGELSQPGAAMIVIVNRGHSAHLLTIKGPGITGFQAQRVAPGGTRQLHVKLTAGAYLVSVGPGKPTVRYFVVHSNIVGAPVNAPPVSHSPTTATSAGGMDCNL